MSRVARIASALGAAWFSVIVSLPWAPTLPAAAASDAGGARKLAQQILDIAGVRGGLIVQLGCGDGALTAALRAHEGYLVQGLDSDAEKVQEARKQTLAQRLYGGVSFERYDGKRLPYADNLVNLVVAEQLGSVPMDEVLRVLAPGGVACVKSAGRWQKTVKPRPAEIDEWTHFLHDATNNAVSADPTIGPPRQLQWVGGPPWTRSHDHLASVSAAACAGGRLFYIVDEGPIAAVVLEPKWQLVACDAFSGVVLWKRPIPQWQWHLRGFRSGPSDLPRRLVAVDQRVYVTLGSEAPLSALDAATGDTITTYEGTDHAREVICHEGTLFVVAGESATDEEKARRRGAHPGFVEVRAQRPPYAETYPPKRLVAIDAASGRLRWKKADADTAEIMPTTLAVSRGRLFFQNAENVVCVDAAVGKPLWQASRPVARNRPAWSAPTLVVYQDVVLSADRGLGPPPDAKPAGAKLPDGWFVTSGGGQSPVGELIAFSAQSGKRLWNCPCREGYNSPVDVLVADGLVWTGDLVLARDPGITAGRDPHSGEIKRTRPRDGEFFDPGMGHHRCYRNKATSRYLVLGRSGVEFIDLSTGNVVPNHWTRGVCQYGVIPCNGLLYVPPHSCACFITSKLNGFNCLTSQPTSPQPALGAEERLERGPAYEEAQRYRGTEAQRHKGTEAQRDTSTEAQRHKGTEAQGHDLASNPQSLVPDPSDWPTYRHDAARSGRAGCAVAAALKPAWQTELGGRLSSLVIAEGRLLVAQIDARTVHALDAGNGRPLWSYTAGGRVDSPPTVWQGCVLFGSADGWVYCVRASDGTLVWRFRAAPAPQQIVSCGQVESAWPVPGSVLVDNGVACCIAGRSSYLDGGIRLCRLDARSGRLLSETVIDHRDPTTGYQAKESIKGTNMPGALPDVLSCDGSSLYLRHLRFDLSGQAQPSDVPHLFSAAGFLDDSWWHRTYWMVGKMMGTNYGGWPAAGSRVPAGRLLVIDGPVVYGFGRNQYSHTGSHIGINSETVFHYSPERYNPSQTYYQAFALGRDAALDEPPLMKAAPKAPAKQGGGASANAPAKAKAAQAAKGKGGREVAPPPKRYRWTEQLPILARAMLLAGDRLFLAGPPDFEKADDPVAAIEGRSSGSLIVISAADGKLLSHYPLERPPVFDGMAAAGAKLYLATLDGRVLCLGPAK